jgi:hypothetical protein
MAITTAERELFGEPLTPVERATSGLIAAVGAVGHLLLVAVVLLLLYGLLFGP